MPAISHQSAANEVSKPEVSKVARRKRHDLGPIEEEDRALLARLARNKRRRAERVKYREDRLMLLIGPVVRDEARKNPKFMAFLQQLLDAAYKAKSERDFLRDTDFLVSS